MRGKRFSTEHLGVIATLMYIFFAIFLVLITIGEIFLPAEGMASYNKPQELPFELRWQEGGDIPVNVKETYDVPRGEIMTVKGTLPDEISDGTCIIMRASQQTLYMYIDGKVRASHDTKDSRIFGKSSDSAYVLCKLTREDAGKELAITLISYTHFSGLVNDLFWGSEFSFWRMVVQDNFAEVIVMTVDFALGIISIIIGAILRTKFKKKQLIEYLGFILMFSSLLIVSESKLRQLVFPNMTVIAQATYLIVPFILVSVLLFTDTMQKRIYHPYYAALQILSYCSIPVIFLLVHIGVLELFNSLIVDLIGAGVAITLICITTIIDVTKKRFRQYREIAGSTVILLVLCLLGYLFTNTWYITSSMGMFIGSGLLILFIVTVKETIRDLVEISREQQRLQYEKEAKDLFFATISHEIRTPINSVLGMNEMILRESEEKETREYAENIENSGRMLLSIINDFLDFSKFQSGGLELTKVRFRTYDLLSETVSIMAERMSAKDLNFILVFSPNLPSVIYGDDVRIKQVIINLLTNACKYTEKGSVTYKVEPRLLKDGGFSFEISVKDTGKGIKKENIDKLYDAYTRVEDSTNRSIEGTGLGLAITKSIVELMGGSVSCESEVNVGSTFTLLIPVEVADPTPIGPNVDVYKRKSTINPRTIVKAPGKKLLIVDDNNVNLSVISGLLKKCEMSIDKSTSGVDAIAQCMRTKYDLIFMDHMMPEMDGFMAMNQIKSDPNGLNKDTPIVALTANASANPEETYIKKGFAGYLSKPINPIKLNSTLLNFLEGAYCENLEIVDGK